MKIPSELIELRPKRILILQLRQIGDVLLCTPAIRALRKKYPSARIDMLVENGPAGVLAGNPHISELILRHPGRGPLESVRNISDVRKNRYDLVIDYLQNPRTALISLLSGAGKTLSFDDRGRGRFYSHTASPSGEYSAEQKLRLLELLGIHDDNLRPVFEVSDRARSKIDGWIEQNGLRKGRYIVIDPTHRRATRLWKHFGKLADAIFKEHGARCVFLWGPGEESYVDDILSGCGADHIKAPPPSFDNFGAILQSSAALVGTCSAPAHIAAALGVPSLQVIGSSRPENWVLPEPIHRAVMLGLECQPCASNDCARGDIECLEALKPEAVHIKLLELAREAAPELENLLESGS